MRKQGLHMEVYGFNEFGQPYGGPPISKPSDVVDVTDCLDDAAVVFKTIPIYTLKNPHPARKRKADCPIEISCKQGWRMAMLQELKMCNDRETVIEKYKRKVEQL